MNDSDHRDEIVQLEAQIDELAARIENCRKFNSRHENEPQGHTALGRTQTRCPARIATMRGVFMNMAVATTIISDS